MMPARPNRRQVATRRVAKRAAAKGVVAAPRESGWAKSDLLGSPRWARPPNAVQAAKAEARRLHKDRHHQGQSGASGGISDGAGGGVGVPTSVLESGASHQSPKPPGAEQQANTSPRRKPTRSPPSLTIRPALARRSPSVPSPAKMAGRKCPLRGGVPCAAAAAAAAPP